MGETKWTEEQLNAIQTRNCNLLVAAAAGSGKTAVLVERIIRIITNADNPVDIDKLLVVTFTNAAAAEMRERIASAISKELDKNPNSKNLQKQLTLLNRANITTMHSFCLDVIKNNFHKIDLDPSFRIGDQTEGVLIKSDVIEELFEDRYENDDQEFINLVEAFSSYKNDDNLKDLILSLYNFTMSGPWPEVWLKESTEAFNINSLDELNKSKWAKVLIKSINIEIEGYIKMLNKAIEIINGTDGLEAYLDNFLSEKEQLEKIYNLSNSGLDELYNLLTNIKFERLKTIKKDKISDEEAQNTVKKIRDDIKKRIIELRENAFSLTPTEMIESIRGAYPYIKKLSEVILDFGDRFSKKKKEKNILDFNDLEHLCLKILIDYDENNNIVPSQVSEDFREFFDEVLVDEYQDSNNVQETIINLVSRKELDNPNVFMVGDVKQSIYRFRQAKPELFIEKYNTYKINEGLNRKIQLYKNFRSREEIINGVNYIFKELMSDTVGELEYTDEESLNLGSNYEISNDESVILGGSIEVNIIDKSDEENSNINYDSEDISDDEEEEITGINLEGKVIARRIKRLMSASNGKSFKVLDKQSGEYRPLKYKDIVILLRATKNYAENLLEELGEEGIPVYADTGSGYFESIEIRTIMSLLKIIDNPLQDVPMLAVLKSPIMGFSAEELTDVRLENKEKYFYENILCIAGKCDEKSDKVYSDKLIKKCNYLIESLEEWRKKSIYMPIDEFIWLLYMDTAYYGYVGAMPNGVLRQANLKILFQRAKQFEQTSFKGLFNFINFINRLTKSSGDMGSAKILGENEDVVRIMSIHKSKGLEFPVVFLCGVGKNFNLMDLNKSILYHHELGFGPDFIDLEKRLSLGTIAKEAIKKKMRLETLSEEMRILYVALTRAKEKLIITGCVSDLQKSIEKWFNSSALDRNIILPSEVLKGKSYLEWIGMALCKHNQGKTLREMIGVSDEYSKDDLSLWKINLINKRELLNKEDKEAEFNNEYEFTIKEDTLNNKLYEEVSKRLDYKYPYELSTTLKSNISVSDLKKKNIEETIKVEEMFKEKEPLIPKFLQERKGLTASEKGTIIHLVMKKIDLNRVSSINEINLQLEEMIDNELLLKDEAKVVKSTKILKFFNNPLGKRMIEAYKADPNNIYREVPFYTEISSLELDKNLGEKYRDEKLRLQGIIDCFFEEDGKIILLDYKNDYIEPDKEEEFKKKYIKQIYYYSEAIFKITGKKVNEKYLYSFHLDKYIRLE
ncbi:MAG: helicase-exonuclease AddAB subunit AddA [Clostridium butyricum]|nr:helicase-exonuclease AddAB subunit AddA [Clostridium butyricum]